MLLLNCVLFGIKTCAFTEGTELCRILHPMVNELLTCATASTFQLHSFPPLMPHGYTCLLPLAFAVIRTMKLRGPVSAGSHIKKGKQKQHSRDPQNTSCTTNSGTCRLLPRFTAPLVTVWLLMAPASCLDLQTIV